MTLSKQTEYTECGDCEYCTEMNSYGDHVCENPGSYMYEDVISIYREGCRGWKKKRAD